MERLGHRTGEYPDVKPDPELLAFFNFRPGRPNWNPVTDLNQDGIVDVFDLVKVGRSFGGGREK